MKNIIFILLLYSCNLFSQTLNDVKKTDSIYFYFSADEYQKKKIVSTNNFTKDTTLNYSYYKNDKEFLVFKRSKFKDFDAFDTNTKTYKQYHKKRFLRKNKRRLVYIDFLNDLNLTTYEFRDILKNKKIFLIDEDDNKDGKILIHEIFISMLDGVNTSGTESVSVFKTRNIIPFYFEMQINDNFYTFLQPKVSSGKKDLYVLFEPSNTAYKYLYQYVTHIGYKKYSQPKIQEQYTFKLSLKNQIVFFQLTSQRLKDTVLEKKYDLFSKQHETISFEDLNSLSENELEKLFSRISNIYIVENFLNKEYVLPRLVEITTAINDFVEQHKE